MIKREVKRPLGPGEIAQIAEFGNNPIKLFDKLHKQHKGKGNRSIVDDIESDCPSKFQADTMNSQKTEYNTLFIVSNDKNIIYAITEQELCKLTIVNCKCQIKSKLKLHNQYQIFSNGSFLINPRSIFAYGNECIVTCNTLDKTFIIYDLKSFTRFQSMAFHFVIFKRI